MSTWKVADILWLESRGLRCASEHPERVARCELHEGHDGPHRHTVATVNSLQWRGESNQDRDREERDPAREPEA